MKQVKILWLVAALFCATTAFGKDIKTVVFILPYNIFIR